MSADQDEEPDELPVDPLLGQPRMVDDPRISVAQGAVVLGKKPAQVHRYVALGRLPRHGPPNNGRPLLVSEVEALRDKGEPIPLKEAALRLGRSLKATLELVSDGHLPLVPGTKPMVYPSALTDLMAEKPEPPIRRPVGPPGFLDTKQTAERLGLTAIYVTQLAAGERLPAVFQDRQYCGNPSSPWLAARGTDRRSTTPTGRTPAAPPSSWADHRTSSAARRWPTYKRPQEATAGSGPRARTGRDSR